MDGVNRHGRAQKVARFPEQGPVLMGLGGFQEGRASSQVDVGDICRRAGNVAILAVWVSRSLGRGVLLRGSGALFQALG